MIKVNAMGDVCPIPVVKTKNAIKEMNGAGVVEVSVDNEIAVQNLTKMANQKGFEVKSEQVCIGEYTVTITVGDNVEIADDEPTYCAPDARNKKVVVAIDKDCMGLGNEELGKVLIKGFIYALTQQDTLPSKILFYNGGATIPTTGSPSLEDLKSLEAQGVEIATCGTCLNYYNLSEELQVGSVTNMYDIVESMMNADLIIKP